MHVCLLSQEFPPDTGWGGIGSYTHEMARGLARFGHHVTVIARAVGPPSVTEHGGVTVHRINPAPDLNRIPGMWRLNGYWPGFAWAAAARVFAIHREDPIDVVDAPENRADSLYVSHIPRGPRVCVRLHTPWIIVDQLNCITGDRKKRLMYALEYQAIRTADAVTAPSRAMVERTAQWTRLPHGVTVIPNPVNVETFSPADGPREPEVLFVGRLERRKGLDALVGALPLLLISTPCTVRFAGYDAPDGKGSTWKQRVLDAVPESSRSRVTFEHIPRESLPDAYRRATVCVLPSHWENFPYALLEGMACGTPPVATAVGGINEMVQSGITGILVPPSDPQALADALSSLLCDPARAATMGRRARTWVAANCSPDVVIPRMLDIYQAAGTQGSRR